MSDAPDAAVPQNDEELSQVEKDRKWLKEVYKGDVPQLTPRALITGLFLGWILALSNLYVGLKSGWGLGVEITAIVIAFAVWKMISAARLTKKPLGMMENMMVMTSAVAPSYITSAGLVSSIPAIWMLDPDFDLPWWKLSIWMMSILFLGLMVAIPVKRQMVNSGELAFPAVVPAAETLKSMYSKGSDAIRKAVSLGIAAIVGVFTKVFTELSVIPAFLTIPGAKIGGLGLSRLTLSTEMSWIFLGFGAFIGPRVGVSLLLGAILNWMVLGPIMINQREIVHPAPDIEASHIMQFPLTIPAGAEMAFELQEANVGPELEDGFVSTAYSASWQDTVVYSSIDELIVFLNTPSATNTLPEALNFSTEVRKVTVSVDTVKVVPFLPFTTTRPNLVQEQELHVRAPEAIYWDANLVLQETAGIAAASILGFEPDAGVRVNAGGYRNIVSWTLWPGVGMMVVAGLLAFAFQWKVIGKAFSGIFRKKNGAGDDDDPLAKTEIPMMWFLIGFTIFGILGIILMDWLFDIPIWMGIIAVILSLFLAVVSIRVSGETGIIPIGAMGKVTQLTFGALHPGAVKTNLMTAGMTAGAATSASDMTNQFKVGHMVGAKARLQFIAQLFGIITALAVVPVFYIMVPDASVIGTDAAPAPAALVWKAIAELLSRGVGSLPSSAVTALIIGSLVAVVITLIEKFYPKSKRWWWFPSPVGFGMAMTIHSFYTVPMFVGAMIAVILDKTIKKTHEMYTIPVASGFIAGESLTGVFFAMLAALGG